MNHRISTTLLLVAAATLLVADAASGGLWEDELPVIQDSVAQNRSYLTIAPDDTVYALWPNWDDWEDTQITLTTSADRGNTWSEPAILFDGLPYDNMDIHADADGVHLLLIEFFEDDENEYKWLYYTKSVDGGETFSEPIQVGERQNIEAIKLFTAPGMIYIYAENYDFEIDVEYNYLYVSSDGGDTWDEKPLLAPTSITNPDFTVHDGAIHIVFGSFFGEGGILYARSTDDGDTWTTPVTATDGAPQYAQLPQIAIDDNAIHVTWEDARFGDFNVMYTRSTDGGSNWSPDQQVNDTYYGGRPRLLADEEGLHVVWVQYHGDDGWPTSWGSNDYGILWYKSSDDSGLTWSDEYRVSQNEDVDPIDLPDMGANHVELAEYSDGFAAMWQDKREGNVDLMIRNNVGPPTADCEGDANGDGVVDPLDSGFVLARFGCPVGTGDPSCDSADQNGDGVVDPLDSGFVLARFGQCL